MPSLNRSSLKIDPNYLNTLIKKIDGKRGSVVADTDDKKAKNKIKKVNLMGDRDSDQKNKTMQGFAPKSLTTA